MNTKAIVNMKAEEVNEWARVASKAEIETMAKAMFAEAKAMEKEIEAGADDSVYNNLRNRGSLLNMLARRK